MTSHDYVIKRKDGSLVKHCVLTRQSNRLYSDASIELLVFDTEKKANEVAKALKDDCEILLYENYETNMAA